MPLVPVQSTTVRADRLFFNGLDGGQDLAPFLYPVPRKFGAYEELLKRLGARERPALQDYIAFLQSLHQETGSEQPLNPNEVAAVLRVVHIVVRSDELDERESRKLIASLFVPDDRSCLVPASQCLLMDDTWTASRVDMRKVNLKYVHPALGRDACKKLGIPSLSSRAVVREELCSAVEAEGESERALGARVQELVRSEGFVDSLAGLVASSTIRVGEQHGPIAAQSPEALARRIRGCIGQVRVVPCSSIRTTFVMSATRANVGVDRDGTAQALHVDAGQCCLRLHVDGALHSLASLAPYVAKGLSMLLGPDLSPVDLLPVAVLLSTASGREHDTLTQLRTGVQLERDSEQLNRGRPGAALAAVDQARVRLRPGHVFAKGEVVAVRRGPDLPLVYARVAEDTAADEEDSEAATSASRVRRAVRRVRVLVQESPDVPLEVLSTEVFVFRSSRRNDAGGVIGDVAGTSGGEAVPEHAASSVSLAHSEDHGAMKPGEISESSAATDVSREELVRALQDLLQRMGIGHFSEQEQRIVGDSLDLTDKLDAARSEAHAARAQLEAVLSENTRMKEQRQCKICCDSDATHYLVPCGHGLCESCLGQLRNNKCPFDRRGFSNVMRLF